MSARLANNSTNAGAPPQHWEKQPGKTPKRYEEFLVTEHSSAATYAHANSRIAAP